MSWTWSLLVPFRRERPAATSATMNVPVGSLPGGSLSFNKKKTIYVGMANAVTACARSLTPRHHQGGLDDNVDQNVLYAAFIPFGELVDIVIPPDTANRTLCSAAEVFGCDAFLTAASAQRHKGFAFVEYELSEDAAAAMENMNNSELFGRTIKCNIAKSIAVERHKAGTNLVVVLRGLSFLSLFF